MPIDTRPIPGHVEPYNTLYAEYRRLYDYFGRGENNVMKVLRGLRRGSRNSPNELAFHNETTTKIKTPGRISDPSRRKLLPQSKTSEPRSGERGCFSANNTFGLFLLLIQKQPFVLLLLLSKSEI